MSSFEEPIVAVGVPLLPQNAPFFLPQLYDGQIFTWTNRPFVVATFGAMYGVSPAEDDRVKRLQAKLQTSDMLDDERLLLTPILDVSEPNTSLTVYLSVNEAGAASLPADKIRYLSGTYLSKVFEGEHANSDWVGGMQTLVEERTGESVGRQDMWASFPERKKLPGKEDTQHCIMFAKCQNVYPVRE